MIAARRSFACLIAVLSCALVSSCVTIHADSDYYRAAVAAILADFPPK
jgi:hypothetical protein